MRRMPGAILFDAGRPAAARESAEMSEVPLFCGCVSSIFAAGIGNQLYTPMETQIRGVYSILPQRDAESKASGATCGNLSLRTDHFRLLRVPFSEGSVRAEAVPHNRSGYSGRPGPGLLTRVSLPAAFQPAGTGLPTQLFCTTARHQYVRSVHGFGAVPVNGIRPAEEGDLHLIIRSPLSRMASFP